jgi:hypothetical protein
MAMTWIEITNVLGNLGEFVGSLLVLGTLIYLAFQVKQAKQLLQTSIALGRGEASREINGLRLGHPRVLELEAQMRSLDSEAPDNTSFFVTELDCTESEANALSLWLYIAMRAIEVAFMTETRSERSTLSIVNVLASHLHRVWWVRSPHLFTADFRTYVDDVLSNAYDLEPRENA